MPSLLSMEERGIGIAVFLVRDCVARADSSAAAASVKLFHFPHSGQRPSHFGSW
jgi:hypothetical protein